jgi:DivIVA domain-containing protein
MRKKQKIEEGTSPPEPAPEAKRVTPVDIQQKEFRRGVRGYSEGEVDKFLDEVTEEVARLYAENRRLREEAELTRTLAFNPTGATEADVLIRQARDEAERILAQARSQAALSTERAARATAPQPSPSGAGSESALSPFVAREKAFLQSLAALIQKHADGVKEDIKRAGQAPTAGSAGDADRAVDLDARPASMETGPPARRAERSGGQVVVVGEPPGSGELSPAFAGRRSAPVSAPDQDQDDGTEDRSLRELFWGQD